MNRADLGRGFDPVSGSRILRDTMPMAVAETEEQASSWWRYERFVTDCGCSHDEAARLTLEGIDWHELKRLLSAGATLAQAERILS